MAFVGKTLGVSCIGGEEFLLTLAHKRGFPGVSRTDLSSSYRIVTPLAPRPVASGTTVVAPTALH